jgi:glycosyltransferase involved in cell wall biosynthesis
MKLVGLILTYNCENLVQKAINKIPTNSLDEVICIDDGSKDNTKNVVEKNNVLFFTHTHFGYGGNLFEGLKIAFERGATHVVEIHGDGQYDLKRIIDVKNILNNDSSIDLILGNRFYDYKKPLDNKMGIIKYIGNIGITFIASLGLGIKSRDLFPGFRVYSKTFYKTINFEKLSKFYWFSFEIIALSVFNNLKIINIPADCDYKAEHRSMSMWKGLPFVGHTLKTIVLFRLAKFNIKLGIFN